MAAALPSLEAVIAEAVRSVVREELGPVRAELARIRQREEEEGVTEREAARRLNVAAHHPALDPQSEARGTEGGGARRVLLSGVLSRTEDLSENVTKLRGP